jgi:hypothetical protein
MTITIPSSVTSIGQRAFYSCETLSSLTIVKINNIKIGYNAFADCDLNTVIINNEEEYTKCSAIIDKYPNNFINRVFEGNENIGFKANQTPFSITKDGICS